MTTMLIAFVVLALVITAMAIGVILGRKPISGSCGGMSALGMEVACDICGGDKNKCEKESAKEAESDEGLAYDASKK